MEILFDRNSFEHFVFSMYIIFLLVDVAHASFSQPKPYEKSYDGIRRVKIFVDNHFTTVSGFLVFYCVAKGALLIV